MKKKSIRISTIPLSLDVLLQGQLRMLSEHYEVVGVSSPGEELDKVAQREGIRTIAVPMERKISPFKDLVSLFRLIRLFHREKPWMVHSLTPKAGLLAMTAAWICRVPVRIHMFTGLVFPTTTGLKQKILMATDSITCACATNILPEGKGVKKDLEHFRITSKPLQIIGNGNINGIDLEFFDRTPEVLEQAEKYRKEEVVTFCFVGRIVRDKGMNELVAAFQRLHQAYPNTRLVLVGPFEEKLDPVLPETRQVIEQQAAIEWMGWQNDIRPFLAASEVFVFPSYREGFPNVVLQAGAMGLPSIVTDINGSSEIITEGVNGSIIPSQNEEALYKAMEKLLDTEERRKLAQQARPQIANRYERKALWKELLKFYRSLEG
jgi:glycosyltransferase involved in cell wall biosynthesis